VQEIVPVAFERLINFHASAKTGSGKQKDKG